MASGLPDQRVSGSSIKLPSGGPRGSVQVSMVRGARGVVLIRVSDVARPRRRPTAAATSCRVVRARCHGILG